MDLLASFDEVTIARGLQYADRGTVTNISEQENGVIARVRGTRRAPYDVRIPFDNDPAPLLEPDSAVCTCPVGVMCKHIVAVTVTYYGDAFWSMFTADESDDTAVDEEEPSPPGRRRTIPFPGPAAGPGTRPSRESLLEELGLAMRTPARASATVLPIEVAARPRGYSPLGEILEPRETRAAATGERWRLAFMVSDRPRAEWRYRQGSIASDDARRACIAPASQFIRKDGVPGRVEKYREDRRHETADPGAEELFEKLSIDGGEAPLLLHLDYLLAHPGLPIYAMGYDGRGNYTQPLRCVRIEHIRIAVLPEPDEGHGSKDISVRPIVRVDLEEGSGAEGPLEAAWVDAWKGRLVALAGNRWLGWCEGDERVLRLVHRLAAMKAILDRGELAELRQKVEAARSSLVTMDLPYRKVRLVTPRPQPDLVLKEQAEGMTANLDFRYPSEEDLAAKGQGGGDEWIVLRRDRAFEENVSRVLHALFTLGDKRIRADNGPWDEPGRWRFKRGMGEFLAACGEELLSRGIGLSIGDPAHRLAGTGVRLQVRVSSGIDWFDLAVSAGEDLDLSRVNVDDPLFARGFVRTGERFVYIGAEEAGKLRRIIALLDPSQRSSRVSRHDLEAAALLRDLVTDRPPMELKRAAEISRALSAPGSFAEASPPRGFRGTLRDYQRVGFGWLSFLAENDLNGCLADDMGLGKTVQALALVLHLHGKGTAGSSASWSRPSPRCRTGRRKRHASPRRYAPSCTTAAGGSGTRMPSPRRTSSS